MVVALLYLVFSEGFKVVFHPSAFCLCPATFVFSSFHRIFSTVLARLLQALATYLVTVFYTFLLACRLSLAVEASPSVLLKYLVLLSSDHALLLHFCSLVCVICKSGGSLECCSFLGTVFCIVLPRSTINPQLSQTVLFTLLLAVSVVFVECCFTLNYWMHGKRASFSSTSKNKKKHVRLCWLSPLISCFSCS